MDAQRDLPGTGADPFLDEIRRMKESVSAAFDHDVRKLCQELRREQEASGRRLIRRKTGAAPRANPAGRRRN